MKFKTAIVLSLIVHFGLIALLIFNYQFSSVEHKQSGSPKPQINAKAINSKKVDRLVKKLKQERLNKQKNQKRQLDKLKKAEQNAKNKRIEEERKTEEAKKRRVKAEENRKLEEKKTTDLKKKRIKEEKERKKKAAEETARQEALEREMQAQMDAEAAELAAANQQQIASEVDKYVTLIRGKIYRNWITPEKTGYCSFKINLSQGGLIIGVSVLDGDPQHCESGQRAIYKSDPLPVSKDPAVFAELKSIKLTLGEKE